MLKEFKDVPSIVNKHGIIVPAFMIRVAKNVYEFVCSTMIDEGLPVDDLQLKYDRIFKHYEEVLHEEHEVNKCTSDEEVWKMHMTHKYNAVKRIIHRGNKDYGVDLYDLGPDNLIYCGARISLAYDSGKIDTEASEVRLYDVHPAYHDGMRRFDISFEDFKKICDKIETLTKVQKKYESISDPEIEQITLDLNQMIWIIGDDGKPMSATIGDAVLLEMQSSKKVEIFTSFEACDSYCKTHNIMMDAQTKEIDSFLKKGYNTTFGAYKSHRYSEKSMDYLNKSIADSISDGDRDPIIKDGGEK